jgi:hypothetical protein
MPFRARRTAHARLQLHEPATYFLLMPLCLLDVVALVALVAAFVRLVPARLARRVPDTPCLVLPVVPVDGEVVSALTAFLCFHARIVATRWMRSNNQSSQGRVRKSTTPRGQVQSRRRGSHPHHPTYEVGALLASSHVGGQQQRKDLNPVRRFWRPPALPGAHCCLSFVLGPWSLADLGQRRPVSTSDQGPGTENQSNSPGGSRTPVSWL